MKYLPSDTWPEKRAQQKSTPSSGVSRDLPEKLISLKALDLACCRHFLKAL
jgi:hypothetical protein